MRACIGVIKDYTDTISSSESTQLKTYEVVAKTEALLSVTLYYRVPGTVMTSSDTFIEGEGNPKEILDPNPRLMTH